MRTMIYWVIGWIVILGCLYTFDALLGEGNTEAQALEAFEEINEARIENGFSALIWDKELAILAIEHSQYMNDTRDFKHSGYPGENILEGVGYCRSGFSVVDIWLKSPLHNGNLMRANIHSGAIGIKGDYATFMAR